MGSARLWLLIGLGSVLVIALVVGGVYYLLRRGDWGPDPDSSLFEVKETTDNLNIGAEVVTLRQKTFLRDGINIGTNYDKPADASRRGDPAKDFSRLATTYYHRRGPIGVVMDRFNWFHGPANTYYADARMPVSLLSLGAGDATVGAPVPTAMLVGAWSEPAIAVLGTEAGTLASYGRPYQYLDFFDRSTRLKEIVDPPEGQPRPFAFLHDARQRGCVVRMFIGDVRQTLARDGADRFYHVLIIETSRGRGQQVAEDLLTKEAMTLYFEKLTEDGILCVHTSHRTVDMVPVVADVAASLGLACVVGKDGYYLPSGRAGLADLGHFSSEWVMVARRGGYLQGLQPPSGYNDPSGIPFWSTPAISGAHVWTDAGPNDQRAVSRNR